MRGYPVHLRKDGESITVSFPDIPDAHTFGKSCEHTLEMAKEALETAMEFYCEDRRPAPPSSPPQRGQHLVELAPRVYAKVLLLNEPEISS